jgi:hypothetical protein
MSIFNDINININININSIKLIYLSVKQEWPR